METNLIAALAETINNAITVGVGGIIAAVVMIEVIMLIEK